MTKFTIIKNNGFKLINSIGENIGETEHDGTSLRRFIEIITAEPDIVEAYRNKEIDTEDESLSMYESDKIIAALDLALAEEIFSDVLFEDDY